MPVRLATHWPFGAEVVRTYSNFTLAELDGAEHEDDESTLLDQSEGRSALLLPQHSDRDQMGAGGLPRSSRTRWYASCRTEPSLSANARQVELS